MVKINIGYRTACHSIRSVTNKTPATRSLPLVPETFHARFPKAEDMSACGRRSSSSHARKKKISGTQGTRSSDFVNHSCDYKLNWTPLGPITVINYFSVST